MAEVKARKKSSTNSKAEKPRRPKTPSKETSEDRATQMIQLREQGYTFGAIAKEFGLTRQRVHQMVSGSVDAPDGNGQSLALRGRGIDRKLEQFKEPKDLAGRLVYLRLKRGWTIGTLSQKSGIPYGVISTYENGKSKPSFESLIKLCVTLKVSAHWLIFGTKFETQVQKRKRKRPQAQPEA